MMMMMMMMSSMTRYVRTYIHTEPRGMPKWAAPTVDPKDDRETRPTTSGISDEEIDEVGR